MKSAIVGVVLVALAGCAQPTPTRSPKRDQCEAAGGVLVYVNGDRVYFREPICIRRDAIIELPARPAAPQGETQP